MTFQHLQRPALSPPSFANTLSQILLLVKFLCIKHPILASELIEQYHEQKYFVWTPKDSNGLRKMIDSHEEELIPDLPLQLTEFYNKQIKESKMAIMKLREQRISLFNIASLFVHFIFIFSIFPLFFLISPLFLDITNRINEIGRCKKELKILQEN